MFYLIALGGLVAAATLAIVMPKANADSGDLVTWAVNNGFSGTSQAIIVRGSLVCTDLSLGSNGEQAARDLWVNTGIVDIDSARQFVIASVVNLCPQYDHRGDAVPTGGSIGGSHLV